MTILSGKRGTFMTINLDTSEGKGVQLSLAGGTDPVGSASLVTSFTVDQAENYAVSQCLNGGVFVYAYGNDPNRSAFKVGVTSFLRTCDGNIGTDLEKAVTAYRDSRVYASKKVSFLTVGKTVFRGYLIGQSINVVQPQLGMINTVYVFLALNVQ